MTRQGPESCLVAPSLSSSSSPSPSRPRTSPPRPEPVLLDDAPRPFAAGVLRLDQLRWMHVWLSCFRSVWTAPVVYELEDSVQAVEHPLMRISLLLATSSFLQAEAADLLRL